MLQPKRKSVKPKLIVNPNAATKQDSITVKEDSKRLLKEYMDRGYEPTTVPFPDETLDQTLERMRNKTGKTEVIRNGIRKPENYDATEFRTPINENQYRQRETASGVLNMDVTPALYDKRIKPTSTIKLMGTKGGTYNDGVIIPSYADMEIAKPTSTPKALVTKEFVPKITKDNKPKHLITKEFVPKTATTPPVKRKVYKETYSGTADSLSKEEIGINRLKNQSRLALKGLPSMKTGGEIKEASKVIKAAMGTELLGSAAPAASLLSGIGAVAAPVLGIVSSIWGAQKAKKEQRKAQLQAQTTNYNLFNKEQDVYAKQFIDDNKADLPVYKQGGTVNTNNLSSMGEYDATGGELLPISDNAQVVSGNTHKENKIDGSYGVTLSADGQPVANVEDKEVIVDNNLVFSDKLKKGNTTFAEIALGVNAKIGELQNKLKSAKSTAEKFSIERTIQGLEKSNQNLFNEQKIVKNNTAGEEQETVKVEDGIVPAAAKGLELASTLTPKSFNVVKSGIVGRNIKYPPSAPLASTLQPASFVTTKNSFPTTSMSSIDTRKPVTDSLAGIGDTKSNIVGKMLPLLTDNITNAILTANAPKPPKPTIRRAPILDTKVNANPQLAAIQKAVGTSNEIVRGNTNNSAVARATMTANNLKGAELSGDVYAKKEALERDARNKQAELNVNNANVNAGLQDEYNLDVADAQAQKNAGFSRNIADAIKDYKDVKQAELLDNASDEEIMINLMNDPTNEGLRTFKKLGKSLSLKNKRLLLNEIKRKQ